MRSSVIGSGIVHLGVLAVLLVVRTPNTIIVPGPDVVQVALVEAQSTPAVAAPAPEAPRKPDPTPVQPTEESGVKLAPVLKKHAPEPEKAPPEPLPATVLPMAPMGGAGLRGQLSVDTNFEFAYYLALVRNRVAQGWAPPAGLTSGGTPVRAVVNFRIARSGEITSIALETGSQFEYFDRAALRAVQLSSPLPPLPLGYTGADLGVHFGFEFVAP